MRWRSLTLVLLAVNALSAHGEPARAEFVPRFDLRLGDEERPALVGRWLAAP
jgi:hypothetical protein